MAAECIHGFEEGLCDTCYPKAPPVRPAAAKAPRAATARAAVASRPAKRTAAGTGAPVNLLDQRVYHLTHLGNLPSILAAGSLMAGDGATMEVDLSSPLTRELRTTAEVAAGVSVASHVPFALAPDAVFWEELRRGAVEPRWSAAARLAASHDFVFLVSTLRTLGSFVLADADAAGTYTRFAGTPDVALGMLGRLHGADQLREAEALVAGSVPFESVQLIGVANEPVRDRVRSLLTSAGLATKVAVYPPWFVEV